MHRPEQRASEWLGTSSRGGPGTQTGSLDIFLTPLDTFTFLKSSVKIQRNKYIDILN